MSYGRIAIFGFLSLLVWPNQESTCVELQAKCVSITSDNYYGVVLKEEADSFQGSYLNLKFKDESSLNKFNAGAFYKVTIKIEKN